jgi:hypothetical protein
MASKTRDSRICQQRCLRSAAVWRVMAPQGQRSGRRGRPRERVTRASPALRRSSDMSRSLGTPERSSAPQCGQMMSLVIRSALSLMR